MRAYATIGNKNMQVYPIKLSQPMGATLAVLGVKGSLALAHGAVGCSSLTKIFFTRHFCDPIAIRTTAVSELAAIFDGGEGIVREAVQNFLPRVRPEVIGLFSTGLTSAKGDDLKRIANSINYPIVYAETPDFEGGLESGWAKMAAAFIEQVMKPGLNLRPDKVLLMPHVSLHPLEVEGVKDLLAEFGLEVHALPDISDSLDGHLGINQASLCQGGIAMDEIKQLGSAGLVISVGASMLPVAEAFLRKSPQALHINIPGLMGLQATDTFIGQLMRLTGREPGPRVKHWRRRHRDALIDSHFYIGRKRFILAGEPDRIVDMAAALAEAGGIITAIIASTPGKSLERSVAHRTLVGDLEDAEGMIDDCDVLISNYHGERIARRHGKIQVLRGFPILEQIGAQLKVDTLYDGGTHFLVEVANAIIAGHPH
ncbi:nitrogenase FeMo-cofactor scaffold and assembly protein NifN [Desulfocucumis palustris]|uniref:Nitrogenase FeMo-cofactor scaffold and assembly protein NifN n=1 Tax=Desulfocucumis palustris TaxID=1898651 RepID=A0A2L2XFQ1_9FIRM|nr:nitrogenase iron-molybdenum cofactor biosynthesis protein NifN [Desulfocucumis palustris]GBF35167.1 nitrogenase FeMo-cofactor scaffold and assembly protein NifN [Desulfocucumis palustris]